MLRERIDCERYNRTAVGIDQYRQSMHDAISLTAHGTT